MCHGFLRWAFQQSTFSKWWMRSIFSAGGGTFEPLVIEAYGSEWHSEAGPPLSPPSSQSFGQHQATASGTDGRGPWQKLLAIESLSPAVALRALNLVMVARTLGHVMPSKWNTRLTTTGCPDGLIIARGARGGEKQSRDSFNQMRPWMVSHNAHAGYPSAAAGKPSLLLLEPSAYVNTSSRITVRERQLALPTCGIPTAHETPSLV